MAQVFTKTTDLPVSAKVAWQWHANPGAFERLNPVFDPVVIEAREGGLEVGASTQIRMKLGPVSQRWHAVHTACEPGVMFRDEQRGGPFSKWVHTHRFIDTGNGRSRLEDHIEYELPVGPLGQWVGGSFTRETIERAFIYRHAITLADLTRQSAFADRPRLTVAITGASGLVASALIPFLTTAGHRVVRVRRKGQQINVEDLEGADAIVHLAGAGIADQRWSDEAKRLFVSSRVDFTRQLVTALSKLSKRPAVLISGSATGLYGDRGDEWVDEQSVAGPRGTRGAEFLSALVSDWEAEALKARDLGIRTVAVRIGIVQTANGGALQKLVVPFKAGVGGPVASGDQWQSWVSLEDLIGIIHFCLMRDSMSGPVNAVAPEPVTSRDYAKVLGRVLHRPAIAPTPAAMLRLVFGEMADGILLPGQRVRPAVLQREGFEFLHPKLEAALRLTLGRSG